MSAALAVLGAREISPEWRAAWKALDQELRDWLIEVGLSGPNIWAGLPLEDNESFMENLWDMLVGFEWP